MFTNEGFERGRREAFEGRERIERRDRIEAESAETQRSRLGDEEGRGTRLNVAGMLNKLAGQDAARMRPGVTALESIRKAQRLGRRTAASHNAAHDRLEKAVGGDFGEALDRLHPASALRKDDIAPGNKDAKAKYDPSGDLSGIEPEFLLDVARALIAAARARAAAGPKGRRD